MRQSNRLHGAALVVALAVGMSVFVAPTAARATAPADADAVLVRLAERVAAGRRAPSRLSYPQAERRVVFGHIDRLYPTRTVAAGATVYPLTDRPRDFGDLRYEIDGRTQSLADGVAIADGYIRWSGLVKLHEDEFGIDAPLVGALIRRRFPALADLPLQRVESMGTVNVIFRIGDDLCVRMPRQASGVRSLEREAWTLPRLGGKLPLKIPRLLEVVPADEAYPRPWLLCDWISGEQYTPALFDDEMASARDRARFVAGLRALDPTGAPRAGRAPLAQLDAITRAAIAALAGDFDVAALRTAWSLALEAPVWDGAPGRAIYRAALAVDAAACQRARGHALHQALLIVPYYRHSNPGFAELAMRTIRELLAEEMI